MALAPLLDRARHRAPRGEKAGRPSDLHPAPPGAGAPGGRNDGRRRPPARRGRSVRPPRAPARSDHAPGGSRSGPAADVEGGSGRSQRQRRHELHAPASPARSERSPTGSTGSHAPTASTIPRPRSTSIRAARSSPNVWPASSVSPHGRFPAAEPRAARRRRRPGRGL